MIVDPRLMLLDLACAAVTGACGIGGAWLLRRRSSLSIRNLYLLAGFGIAVTRWQSLRGRGRRRSF